MAFRGGRGGARGGGIKGATWEHDATLKLDFTPSEDYPVRLVTPSPSLWSLVLYPISILEF